MSVVPNYWDVLQEGIAALDEITQEIAATVTRDRASPEQVLTLRDVSGLSARLAATTPEEWRYRLGLSPFTGQDLGVLTELIEDCEASSPYRDDARASVRLERARRLRALYEFLDGWDPEMYDAAFERGSDADSSPRAAPQHRDQQQN